MTGQSWFVLSVRKDLRAMAPVMLASVSVMALALLLQRPFWNYGFNQGPLIGGAAYVIGAVTLGALVIGHEYLHRTLGLLSMQPVSRRRLVLAKMTALAAGLLLIAVAGVLCLPVARGLGLEGRFGPFYFLAVRAPAQSSLTWSLTLLPLLCAVFVAPWLTMLFRNVLAGVVFTICIPALVWLVADAAISFSFRDSGYAPAAIRDMSVQVLWFASLAFCAVGAVLGWRTFMRLEARDEPAVGVSLGSASRHASAADRTRPSGSVLALARKELRIQQMAFVLAALYAIAYAALQIIVPVSREFVASITMLLFALYAVLLTVLIGASSVAEERRLGTMEWQLLLPMSARRQWTIKVAVALALATVLVGVLPWLMTMVVTPIEPMRRISWEPVAGFVIVLLVAVHVSSWTRDGLRAVLLAGVVLTGGVAVFTLSEPVKFAATRSAMPALDALAARVFPNGIAGRTETPLTLSDPRTKARIDRGVDAAELVVVALGALLLIRFGYRNYRTPHVTRRTVGRQLAFLLAAEMAGTILFGVFTQAGWAVLDQEPWIKRAREQMEQRRLAAPKPPAPKSPVFPK